MTELTPLYSLVYRLQSCSTVCALLAHTSRLLMTRKKAMLQRGTCDSAESHLQALLDLLRQSHACTSVGCQVDQRQLLFQGIFCRCSEYCILLCAE